MAIEIVDLAIKHGDFPISFLYVYQRVLGNWPSPSAFHPLSMDGTAENWVVGSRPKVWHDLTIFEKK